MISSENVIPSNGLLRIVPFSCDDISSVNENDSSNVVVRSFPVCCVDTMFCSGGISSTVVSDIGFSASSGGNSTGSSTGIDSGGNSTGSSTGIDSGGNSTGSSTGIDSGGNSTGSSTGIDSGGPTSSPRGSSCPNAYPQYNTEYENGAITDDETKITIKIYETIFCM